MEQKQFIKDLNDKTQVDSIFLVRDKNIAVGKNGRAFMSMIVGDSTGSIDARLWDKVEEIADTFIIGDLVNIKGAVQLFQNRKQLIVHKLIKVDSSGVNLEDYLQKSNRNTNEMFAELYKIVSELKNDHIKQLIFNVIDDPDIKPKFLKAPAAKTIHHAWVGGLLEHILSISKIMVFISSHYPNLNKDLLVFGAIFHDIGKLWELSYDNGISYTDRGRLLGHMQIACELIDKKTSKILGFSDELKDILKHIILSHHGKLEYGSPKRPKFLEALIVAMIDDFDSKVATLAQFINEEKESSTEKWSKLNSHFERYFLLKLPE